MNISKIKIVATDVDGVLTDGKIFYSIDKKSGKTFSTKDGLAFRILRLAGLKSMIISGKKTGIIENRFSDIEVDVIFEGIEDKLAVMQDFCKKEGLLMENVCYIGDDLTDIPLLKSAGFSVAPVDAVSEVRSLVTYVSGRRSGEGVFRDCVEIILRGQKKWEETLEKLFSCL